MPDAENAKELYDELLSLKSTMRSWVLEIRNTYMVQKILSLLSSLAENQKIFVVAGEAHLSDDVLNHFLGQYSAVFFKTAVN